MKKNFSQFVEWSKARGRARRESYQFAYAIVGTAYGQIPAYLTYRDSAAGITTWGRIDEAVVWPTLEAAMRARKTLTFECHVKPVAGWRYEKGREDRCFL